MSQDGVQLLREMGKQQGHGVSSHVDGGMENDTLAHTFWHVDV